MKRLIKIQEQSLDKIETDGWKKIEQKDESLFCFFVRNVILIMISRQSRSKTKNGFKKLKKNVHCVAEEALKMRKKVSPQKFDVSFLVFEGPNTRWWLVEIARIFIDYVLRYT